MVRVWVFWYRLKKNGWGDEIDRNFLFLISKKYIFVGFLLICIFNFVNVLNNVLYFIVCLELYGIGNDILLVVFLLVLSSRLFYEFEKV